MSAVGGPAGSLAVRGGRVVLADRVVDADLLILEHTITAVARPGAGEASEEIDARGLVVLPGAVDAHVHVNEPGRTEWEGWLAATRGAARGGTTTIADMPLNSIPPTTTAQAFDAKVEAASRSAVVDHALWGGLVDADTSRLRDLAALGVVGVKAFMCPSGVDEFPHLAGDALEPALRAAAAAGLLVAVHCEDAAVDDGHSVAAEVRAIERLADAAVRTGARVHVVHASSAEAVDAAARGRGSGARISVETCPHYLAFTSTDAERIGPALKCAPPIRRRNEELWAMVLADRVDLVASDHSPSARELKERHWEAAWGGVTGVQTLLAVMLTEGVHARRLSLPAVAQLVATRPAKRLGLHPRKGEIRAGADADLALVDLEAEWTLAPDDLEARSGISPYVGRRFTGRIARTMVRGRTVFDDGRVTGEPGGGRSVRRLGG